MSLVTDKTRVAGKTEKGLEIALLSRHVRVSTILCHSSGFPETNRFWGVQGMPKKGAHDTKEGEKVKVLLKIVTQSITELPLSENGSLVYVEWKTGTRKKHRGKTISVLSREGVASWSKGNELEVQSTLKFDENEALQSKKVALRIHTKRGKKKKIVGKTVIDVAKYARTNNSDTTETFVMGKATAPKLRVRFRCYWLQKGHTKFVRSLDESGNLEDAFRVENAEGDDITTSSSPHTEGESTATFSEMSESSVLESSETGEPATTESGAVVIKKGGRRRTRSGGAEDIVIPSPTIPSSSSIRKKRSSEGVDMGNGSRKAKSSIKTPQKGGKKKRRSKSPAKLPNPEGGMKSSKKGSKKENVKKSGHTAAVEQTEGVPKESRGEGKASVAKKKGKRSSKRVSRRLSEAHGQLDADVGCATSIMPPPLSVALESASNATTTPSDGSPRALTSEDGELVEKLRQELHVVQNRLDMKNQEIHRLESTVLSLSTSLKYGSVYPTPCDGMGGKLDLPRYEPGLWVLALVFLVASVCVRFYLMGIKLVE